MIVHRRCIAKVGNYCGCKDNVLALYEKWKETVSLNKIQGNVIMCFVLA
jgi:hypothetical protein